MVLKKNISHLSLSILAHEACIESYRMDTSDVDSLRVAWQKSIISSMNLLGDMGSSLTHKKITFRWPS